jgi:hypothetical protein
MEFRATYTADQIRLIDKYNLWRENLYASKEHMEYMLSNKASMQAIGTWLQGKETEVSWWKFFKNLLLLRFAPKIEARHLINGKRLTCPDIMDLLEAETQVQSCARNLLGYIAMCETFDGREIIYEINLDGK